MKLENVDWGAYYDKIQGRPPRPLLRSALEVCKTESDHIGRQAIDLGCGDGTDSIFLLENGWRVLAIDGEASAIERLHAKVPDSLAKNLQTRVAKFEEVSLPTANLIHASLTLPFCHPNHFAELWQKIVVSLGENGRFAGQFFGIHDSWAVNKHMTFHTEVEVRAMFSAFDLEFFHEEDAAGRSTSGSKHWHIFTVIARR